MSSYRDDAQETAVASDSVWLRGKSITEEQATAADELHYRLRTLTQETAAASDLSISGHARSTVSEAASASDATFGQLRAAVLVAESAMASEHFSHRLRFIQSETAAVGDASPGKLRALVKEQATVADTLLGKKRVTVLVAETAKATDYSIHRLTDLALEAATASDQTFGKLRGRVLVIETAALSGLAWDAYRSPAQITIESARVADATFGQLRAAVLVVETAVIEDAMAGDLLYGQAWTADANNWAMSRYAPFSFNGMAVIDGVLYATSDAGVFALGEGSETITGGLTTGKLDIGGSGLVHPLGAYLEYELAAGGSAAMDVTTTQSGSAQTYSYPLESEPAEEITNGRFKFGRGLRGRHFSFALRLTGAHAYINDLRVDSAPTKRRV